jgi:hypothetical protein
VLRLQSKLNTAQELTLKAGKLLEESIPARLKEFEQRLVSVTEKHAGIKARFEEQVKALKEEVANKNGVGELRRAPLAFAPLRPQLEPFRILSPPPLPSLRLAAIVPRSSRRPPKRIARNLRQPKRYVRMHQAEACRFCARASHHRVCCDTAFLCCLAFDLHNINRNTTSRSKIWRRAARISRLKRTRCVWCDAEIPAILGFLSGRLEKRMLCDA